MSVKREVYARAKGRCERCGLKIPWGDPRGVFHHTRSPSISPTAKTVQFLCRNCHAKYGHKIKTVTRKDPFLGLTIRKEIRIKRKKVRKAPTRKSSKKTKGKGSRKKR